MGTFLLWVIGTILAINIVFRLFGRQLLALGMRQIAKRLMRDAEAQTQAYRKHYGSDQSRQNIYVDKEVTVSAPRAATEQPISEDDIVEDVDFEEVSDNS